MVEFASCRETCAAVEAFRALSAESRFIEQNLDVDRQLQDQYTALGPFVANLDNLTLKRAEDYMRVGDNLQAIIQTRKAVLASHVAAAEQVSAIDCSEYPILTCPRAIVISDMFKTGFLRLNHE